MTLPDGREINPFTRMYEPTDIPPKTQRGKIGPPTSWKSHHQWDDQTARRMLGPKPSMSRALTEDHHPLLGLWSPAEPMPARTSSPLGGDFRPPADASDCLPADADPLNDEKLLGKMSVVERGVLGAR